MGWRVMKREIWVAGPRRGTPHNPRGAGRESGGGQKHAGATHANARQRRGTGWEMSSRTPADPQGRLEGRGGVQAHAGQRRGRG